MINEAFIEAYTRAAETNRARLGELDAVLTAFERAGVEVLPLKGADMLGRAYGGILGLRPMTDVDLLFHRQDFPKIERILATSGFRPREDGNPCFVSSSGALILDMISEIWYREDDATIWKRSMLRPVAGKIRPAMHPEDALIYTAAYQTIHRGRLEAQMACDIAALLKAEGTFIDWRRVVGEIAGRGLNIPLHYGLSYARDTTGAAIPSWVLEALRPMHSQRKIAALYQRLVADEGVPQVGYLFLVVSRHGWRNKLHALCKVLFPSRDFLGYRYGDRSHWGRLWICISRPIYLIFNGGRLLFRIGRRLILPNTGTSCRQS